MMNHEHRRCVGEGTEDRDAIYGILGRAAASVADNAGAEVGAKVLLGHAAWVKAGYC